MVKTVNWYKLLVLPLILVYAFVLVRTAWICDDAYITFRSVENFIHGYGLVFNVGERVQTYTHPLWLFIMSGLNAITQRIGMLNPWAQMYYVDVYLSMVTSLGVVLLLAFGIARSVRGAALSVAVLVLSKSFIDYSTSGLENPLTHLILTAYCLVLFHSKQVSDKKVLLLSFLACLGVLNRMDILLLFIPSLVYLIWQSEKRKRAVFLISLGFLPFILWELFSVFYYGTPFPNTAYAKINTGINQIALLRQGLYYYANTLRIDPITLSAILASIVLCFYQKRRNPQMIATGISLYMLYILYIGGDFMSGRFFSAPVVAAAIMLSIHDFPSKKLFYALSVITLVLGLASPNSPVKNLQNYGEEYFKAYIDDYGISDERAVYFPRLGFMVSDREKPPPGSKYGGQKWVFDKTTSKEIELVGPLGVHGYQLGPNIHVIDVNGLADPLMARLPIEDPNQWRIGHFKHIIPEGYLDTLSSDDITIEDENLAMYYQYLRSVVRDDLFNQGRLALVWNLNIGKYDYLLDAYLAK